MRDSQTHHVDAQSVERGPLLASRHINAGRTLLAVTLISALHGGVYWWLTHTSPARITSPDMPTTVSINLATSSKPQAAPPALSAPQPVSKPERNANPPKASKLTHKPVVPKKTPDAKRQFKGPSPESAISSNVLSASSSEPEKSTLLSHDETVTGRVSSAASASQNATPAAMTSEQEAASVPAQVGRFRAQNPKPEYPVQARRRHMEGLVVIAAYVSAEGRVIDAIVKTSSGHRLLDEKALDTVRAWQFEPAHRGVGTVKSWISVPINFSLK